MDLNRCSTLTLMHKSQKNILIYGSLSKLLPKRTIITAPFHPILTREQQTRLSVFTVTFFLSVVSKFKLKLLIREKKRDKREREKSQVESSEWKFTVRAISYTFNQPTPLKNYCVLFLATIFTYIFLYLYAWKDFTTKVRVDCF